MSGEKKHAPTQKKLEDAQEEGQVAVSKDIGIIAKLSAFYLFFFWVGRTYIEKFSELIDSIVKNGIKNGSGYSQTLIDTAFDLFFLMSVPIAVLCAIAGTLSTWAQIGMIVSPKAATPSFKKMDAVGNIKNMFSKKSLVQLFLSIGKVMVLTVIGYLVFMDSLSEQLFSFRLGLSEFFVILMEVLQRVILFSLAVFVILSVIDWVMEKSHLIKTLRMSDQDLKDEHKKSEGDPQMKQKRKKLHRNLLNSSLNRMSSAKAVVANPTHISVALDYEPGKYDLPYVLAMGVDDDALTIREIAKQKGIPIIVNVKLARMIYQDCDEEEFIQKQHLELAAEVFKAVMELKNRGL